MRTFIALVFVASISFSQARFETRDKIQMKIMVRLEVSDDSRIYAYQLVNGTSAKQSIWKFVVFAPPSLANVRINSPLGWLCNNFIDGQLNLKWFADVADSVDEFKDEIKPGSYKTGFSCATPSVPGVLTYYAEGWADAPSFPEGMATDSIPGYTDLTPYGPGIVGKTVGPVMPLDPYLSAPFLDTLISYVHQSHELGWINNTRDDDCEEDEQAQDGIVRNLEKRLTQTRDLIIKDKIGAVKNRLQKFLGKVEKLWARQQKEEAKNRKNPKVIFTSEAYALLKYNGEYLLDHLTETKETKEDKKGKEK